MYTILVIEDDPSISRNIDLILTMEGFTVLSAVNGQEGLRMARKKRPDLILCDILMPSMDGHAVLDALKNEDSLADIPFIFVTALGERSDMRRGMSRGADDYLTKPFSADELIAAVTGRLQRLETLRLKSSQSAFQEELAILRQHISKRELEVLHLVGRGATSRKIAEQLKISARTVEVHRSNLMSKLGASNAAILARWAVIAEQLQEPVAETPPPRRIKP